MNKKRRVLKQNYLVVMLICLKCYYIGLMVTLNLGEHSLHIR